MQSTMLLIASLGAVFIILTLYVNIFLSERRAYLALWFVGWAVIALNYGVDAFAPALLRGNRLVFLASTASYTLANFMIVCGIYSFLEIKIAKPLWMGGAAAWLAGFVILSGFWPDLALIAYANAAIFVLTFQVGVVMIRSGRKQGRLAFFLGMVNIAWVLGAIVFSYVLRIDQILFYVVMHGMRFVNAIGLIQMSFRSQKSKIQHGLQYIQHLSECDELTGLYNKRYFDAKVLEFDRADDCLPVTLLVGDMNGLKFVNDVFGHQEGDNWIKKAALLLQQTCRKQDIVARWGGDEFAVIFLRTGREEASAILGRILEACAAQRDGEIPVSISMGLATKADMRTSLGGVLQAAEKAMYEMKLVEGKKARSAIIRTIEARMVQKGYETGEHLMGLERLAAAFARALGLPPDGQADLLMAAKYCDIGKIGLPDEAVRREARLDEREWTVLKKHVEIGYRIVCALSDRAPVADAVLFQHESWDGQGFPQGLKGEEIPPLARAVAILRAFDAMTSPAAAGEDATAAALETLRRSAGTRFDPDLAAQFARMMTEKAMTWAEAEKEVCVRRSLISLQERVNQDLIV
jgi:diguanylate cyclase (GGDEF)-like protein